ncbi:hypothetical protein LTR84_004440 [Exophiala bonariae]|uniref:Transcription factor domain-containing protein n=1 Tax=Exophiala bonariae TaxID=1690606 RepID=A0AAV9N849_9EURO|nr:hypothetical protein LTR84_004440 [Exophiala bonariae]
MVSPDRLQKQMDLRGLLDKVSPSLLLEMKLGSILSRVNVLFSPSTFLFEETRDAQSKFARTMMSDIFENQLDELQSERTFSSLEELYLNVTRLQLRLHCLSNRENPATSLQLGRLGIAATSIIDLVEHVNAQTSLVTHCPHYIYRMTALTAAVLLRLTKQSEPLTGSKNPEAARNAKKYYKSYFFRTISLLKSMSVDSNDMPSRMAKIFSQLWTVEKLFEKQPNRSLEDESGGNESASTTALSSPLVVQSRLSMSVLHDCMWRWKEHFIYSQSSRNPMVDPSHAPSDQARSNTEPTAVTQQQLSGMTTIAPELTAATASSRSCIVPLASSLTAGPTMSNSENIMTPSFIQDFSPLAALPWDTNMNDEFEMMVHHFPDSWPV